MTNKVKQIVGDILVVALIIMGVAAVIFGICKFADESRRRHDERVQFIKLCIKKERAHGARLGEAVSECRELWSLRELGYIDE
jgi:hypothetical protein